MLLSYIFLYTIAAVKTSTASLGTIAIYSFTNTETKRQGARETTNNGSADSCEKQTVQFYWLWINTELTWSEYSITKGERVPEYHC